MRPSRTRLSLSLGEAMTAVAIAGLGLALPAAIVVPLAILGAAGWTVPVLPSGRWARAGAIVLGTLVVALLLSNLFPAGLIRLRVP